MNEDLFKNNNQNPEDSSNSMNGIDEKNLKLNEKNNDKNLVKKIAKMTFEEALSRLDKIVEILSSQKNNLEDMIQLYEEAKILKDHCDKRLGEAKMKIENINKNQE